MRISPGHARVWLQSHRDHWHGCFEQCAADILGGPSLCYDDLVEDEQDATVRHFVEYDHLDRGHVKTAGLPDPAFQKPYRAMKSGASMVSGQAQLCDNGKRKPASTTARVVEQLLRPRERRRTRY